MRVESKKEEFLNFLSHFIGLILSFIGLIYLINLTYMDPNKTKFYVSIVYGGSLIFMYSCSSLYHYFYNTSFNNKLRIIDHISIFILIAGSYTPGLLLKLQFSLGIELMYLVWGIAVIGTIYKYFFIDKFKKYSLFLYILMGWLIVLDFDAVVATLSVEGLKYMIFGGLFYMIGVIFYSLDRIKYNHVIWHIFVLAGSISHYMMVLTII
jgi:hemolysin III